MNLKACFIALAMWTGVANAHQFTPTYPVFEPSFVDGVVGAKMELFNKRREVEYYELGVFSADWKPVSFVSQASIINIRYLETKRFTVYVRARDLPQVTYICTESRLRKEDVKDTVISSRICSKVKQ